GPATATPDPRQRPAGLRLLPALAASGHDGAHLERQQGRRDHLLRRPRAARPLRSSRTHLADKDGFDVKWKPPFRGHSRTLAHASDLRLKLDYCIADADDATHEDVGIDPCPMRELPDAPRPRQLLQMP